MVPRRTDGGSRPAALRYATPAVALLTALAFGLRLIGIDQALAGDEFFTYQIVVDHGPIDIVREVHRTSITPPLHYLLAYLGSLVGDPAVWLRVPSLLLSTATVPVVYLLGRRTVGERAALVGAAVVALSPFAVWFGDEARAYATLTFLSALSTYALVEIFEDERATRWWVVLVLASVAALYTHYTAIFVVGVQAAWAIWVLGRRGFVLRVLTANAVIAIAYLPWLPSYFHQRGNPELPSTGQFHVVEFEELWQVPTLLLFGQPHLLRWDVLLGTSGLRMIEAAAVIVLVAALFELARRRRFVAPRPTTVLLILLAAAAPVGLYIADQVGPGFYVARAFSVSLPAAVLLLGVMVTGVRRPLWVVPTGLLLAAVTVATVRGFDPDRQRPPAQEAVRVIDREARPNDLVVVLDPSAGADRLGRDLRLQIGDIYMDRPHVLRKASLLAPEEQARAVRDASPSRKVFALVRSLPFLNFVPRPSALVPPRFRLVESRTFPGYAKVGLFTYVAAAQDARATVELDQRGGREAVHWSLGGDVGLTAGAVGGSVDAIEPSDGGLLLRGWAADTDRGRLADYVLAFSDRRLVAAAVPEEARKDVAKIWGDTTEWSGWRLTLRGKDSRALARGSRVRVVAVAGDEASELDISDAARAALEQAG